MDEKKAKELTDSIFNKLNDQERVYLAWIHNQKNKEIQELKKENEFLKLSNPAMNLEHFRYVKENKRKIDNLRLVNKRLSNNWNELEKWIEQGIEDGKGSDNFINGMRFVSVKRQYFQMFSDKIKELKGVIENENS